MGGLPLVGGGVTRSGVLYRGDAPHPGDVDPTHVSSWPPATVIDLRSADEAERIGHVWGSGPTVCRHPLHDAAAPDRPVPDTLAQVYRAMVREVPHRIAATVGSIARHDGPVLVHCTLGKDRTGVVVAVALLTVGVHPDAVVADYLATAANVPVLRDRLRAMTTGRAHRAGHRVDRSFLDVTPDGIASVVDAVSVWPGGPVAWCVDHGTDPTDIDTLRDRLRHT